ncbi:MAG: hypothetical protein JWO09_3232 [Bacteroidetes bacterium]|nr:hypothetical protein [Bacteroidota bacterium]
MKRSSLRFILFSGLIALSFAACKGGNADKDGNKSIEGSADPANTGGKLGGSDQTAPSSAQPDSTSGNR